MRQLHELSKVFPEKFIHKNPTGFGAYIQHSVIRQRLLSVLGEYSQEVKHIIREKITDKQGVEREVITGVVLALTVEIDGNLVTIEEVGDVDGMRKIDQQLSIELALKAAAAGNVDLLLEMINDPMMDEALESGGLKKGKGKACMYLNLKTLF